MKLRSQRPAKDEEENELDFSRGRRITTRSKENSEETIRMTNRLPDVLKMETMTNNNRELYTKKNHKPNTLMHKTDKRNQYMRSEYPNQIMKP